MKKTLTLFAAAVLPMFLNSGWGQERVRPDASGAAVKQGPLIRNNTEWLDTAGNRILAHSGGISRFGGRFYWYGNDFNDLPNGLAGQVPGRDKLNNGVLVYSSSDLVNWTYEAVAVAVPAKTNGFYGTTQRPHVIYNAATKTYVMWFFRHRGIYPDIMATVATSASPVGPFAILRTEPTGSPKIENAPAHGASQRTFGPPGCAQDLDVFQDADQAAYLVYDDGLRTIRIDRLSDDYLSSLKNGVIALPGRNEKQDAHEGPAMTRYRGKYIVAASGVKGWGPTPTFYVTSDNPLGPYSEQKLLAPIPGLNTWNSQLTDFVYIRETDSIMVMCDQWWIPDVTKLNRSRYLWLPLAYHEKSREFEIIYRDSWSPFE